MLCAAAIIGAISGVGSWALFESLDHATSLRIDHSWLLWLLPLVALVLGLAYHYAGGETSRGTSLVIESSLPPSTVSSHASDTSELTHPVKVPSRMAPMIFGATYLAQLTGASVGREGAALQIAGSLSSLVMRPFRIAASDARLMMVASMAGAFGGAFGVPIAGAVFALEVQQTGRLRYDALAPALVASIAADIVEIGQQKDLRHQPLCYSRWRLRVRVISHCPVERADKGLYRVRKSLRGHGLQNVLETRLHRWPILAYRARDCGY